MDAGAVAGLAVGVHRAAVPDGLERVDAGLHHLAARLAVERGDQADAAGIVLRQVDAAASLQERGVGRPGPGEFGAVLVRHRHHSAATAAGAAFSRK